MASRRSMRQCVAFSLKYPFGPFLEHHSSLSAYFLFVCSLLAFCLFARVFSDREGGDGFYLLPNYLLLTDNNQKSKGSNPPPPPKSRLYLRILISPLSYERIVISH